MACTLKIAPPVGLTTSTGTLTGIKIFGSATNCDQVTIAVKCDGATRQFSAKVIDSAWSIIVPPGAPDEHPCQCNSSIVVEAGCQGGGCEDKYVGTLTCEIISNCPDLTTSVDPIDKDSKCDPGGKRTVTGSVIVAPDPSKAVGATVLIGTTVVASHPDTTTPYTLNFSTPLPPGTYSVTVKLDSGCGSSSTPFTVPTCPGSEACPKVGTPIVKEGDCRDGKRIATVTVPVTPGGGLTSATLMHGGTTLDSATGKTGPFDLSGTDTFSPSDSVVVNVSSPTSCPPTSVSISVKPCQPSTPTPTPPGGSSGNNGDDGSGGCLIGRVVVALLLGTALFLALVGFCVPGAGTAFLIAAAAAAAAGAIAFALWWLLCGSKCGALLISWQITMIGAWVSAFLAACCPAALVLAIALGASALGLFTAWIKACSPSKCKIFSELLWVYVTVVGTVFAYLTKFVPCGLVVIPTIAGTIAAGIAIAVAGYCKK